MFYSLDDIASHETWTGAPLGSEVIIDAEMPFHSAAAVPGAARVHVASEAWPATAPETWLDDAAWDDEVDPAAWRGPSDVIPAPPPHFAERLSAVAVELTAGLLLLFLLLAIALDRAETAPATPPAPAAVAPPPAAPTPRPLPPDPDVVVVPYETFWVTQGLHGFSYGHMAVDLAGGKGSTVLSPVNGIVESNFVDQYGNTTLVIANERYRVTMLHGSYGVAPGDRVTAGQPVGVEGNHGYTTDMQGRSCRNRECGYHTHLNIYDKLLGRNVNPLLLLDLQ